jgi:PAS domain S-box-containing protein
VTGDDHPSLDRLTRAAAGQALAAAATTETALRKANRELELASRRMRAVLDTTQDAFVSADASGVVTAWNAAAERLFDYPAADAVGRRITVLIIPIRLRDAHEAGMARVRGGGVSHLSGQRMSLVALNRAGHEFPIEMTLQVIDEDGDLTFHAFIHDISDRQADQLQLEEDRTFLQALLDSLDTGVAACDADGNLAVRNRALRSLEASGEPALHSSADTDRLYGIDERTLLAADEEPLARAFAGERVTGQHITIHGPDGRWHHFVANGQPITTPAGRRLGAVAALHDVTDQHRAGILRETQHAVAQGLADADSAEAAATATIAAVATALDWAGGEFWQADPAQDTITRIGFWSAPKMDLSAFGGDQPITFARGEGLAGIVWDTNTELWIPELADDPRTVARRDEAHQVGLHTAIGLPVRSDGHTLGVLLFFATTVDKPDNDLLIMLDGVCAHLGRHFERRRAEDLALALAASRRAFERVIAQVNDYVWTFEIRPDGSRETVYANLDGSGIFGGHFPAEKYVHPGDRDRLDGLFATVVAGRPGEAEIRVVGMDGVSRWVWIRAVSRQEGDRLFVDGISTNVTDRRELADQRERLLTDQRQQNRKLRELDRMKDELVALVSHELRNPLSSIAAYTEMLLADPDLVDDHRHLVNVIDKHSKHMNGLVDDLLDVASLESGQMGINPRAIPLGRLVHDSADDQEPLANAKHLVVNITVPRHLPVYADPARLRQVLDNLMSNAIKYTPTGGTVTITGHREDSTTVLTVTDSGIGIPAEQYPHLFDRFFRASNAIEEGIKGTGLGLAISKAIIDAHAGSLRAEPAGPSGGTTFTLTLPSTAPAG